MATQEKTASTGTTEDAAEPGEKLAGGELIKHNTHRVKISSAIHILAQRLFRSEVERRAQDGSFGGEPRGDLDLIPVGFVDDDDLPELYRSAMLFAFPSYYEGFGLPAVEAMAAGTPLVCSDIPVLHEVAGEAALFASPERPEEMALQVQRVLADDSLRRELTSLGAERLAEFEMHRVDLSQGAVLEKGCVYVVPLAERLALPAVVIDAGSAITVDWISADGRFGGGAILPGLDLQSRALARGTEALPQIHWEAESELRAWR